MEEVVIVGAGIAGLATAVALKRVGVQALVLEKAPGLRSTGAAINLMPNAWLALDALCVSHKLTPLYHPITKDAKPLTGTHARCVHRKALLEALAEELPKDAIRCSSKLISVEHGSVDPPCYVLLLEDGSTIMAKAVIGCDGVHSMIARKLGLRPPIWSGRSSARGLSAFPEGHGLSHGNLQFVDLGRRGGLVSINDNEIYWFLTCRDPNQSKGIDWARSPASIKEEVIAELAKGFPEVYLDVVRRCDPSTLTWTPLMLRLPWDILFGNISDGNMTVAGDALHPMTPDLGQGGGLALEDAVVLGRHIGLSVDNQGKISARDLGRSLRGYARERRWRAAAVVGASYFSGWVQVAGSRWWHKLLQLIFYGIFLQQILRVMQYDCGKLPRKAN
ncbi:hypothetical protein MLD38_021480 [Melastoma candidum]|uniref:Uncharacterized protein n=1 Tax=Melastoma candidum TaxID=119954 RepID=A0ACB9QGA7_9MYRT|nr:hypothetical protein MLD38_021480 [Melastoma candidum]